MRIDATQKLGEDQNTQHVTQPQSHTFLQGEETMLSKAWSIVALTVVARELFTAFSGVRQHPVIHGGA
ncbi:hypothetical protein ABQW55_000565 [Xanthomonas citri pv. malvacearum]|uniref:hypothetical protein n=1 Tax=Xanthomonas TaxID=338 RepID=UPI000F76F57D|nr:hypothetical protein [Xanthomonas citri]NMI14753.1 hypothetical protein [Xanthomonas citri]QGL16127.1 hypothetical protein GH913_04300 [Xanthomonas citri pv. malvacearum]WAW87199.1 hypothetical protein LPY96_01265 [Xanthomonas citri pv. malvacearum]WAW91336.1 hypothetical protein LPY95_00550 [Xanthomonas citri pv. malvacearum]WAW95499.1 hypothetical protein LGM68_00555 [Xanthomonas citri pv. malvacearum]